MDKTAIAGFTPEELCSKFRLSKPFMGKQIFKWIAAGVDSFDEMTDLSLEIRRTLNAEEVIRSGVVTQKLEDPDGTVKLQITFPGDAYIETVLLADESRRFTACVSSQAGCALGCKFCRTGQLGFTRNLSAAEIIEQFLLLEKMAGPLDNVVFMGMGEPLMNPVEVKKAIAVLTHPGGRNLSPRRITVSTSGIISGIYDLAENSPSVRLAVSLTTADKALRNELMPVARENSLAGLKDAISYYTKKTLRRCTLEAALIAGINTGTQSAVYLAEFAEGLDVHVNLIPWNPVPSLSFAEPGSAECREFVRILESRGIPVTLRTRRGRKIGGACGQLGKENSQFIGKSI